MQNAASTLLANIQFSNVDKPIRTINVTSSVPNDGKTTVATSLAIAVCATGKNILIIEGDFRRRSLRHMLDAKGGRGIYSLLSGSCSYKDAIVKTSIKHLDFLDAEAGINNPNGILSSKRFGKMLETLKENYSLIIIDTPPLTAFPDAAIIASKTDGTILVCRQDYTDISEAEYSIEQLSNAHANLLGVVMNGITDDTGRHSYYYNYYYSNSHGERSYNQNSRLKNK